MYVCVCMRLCDSVYVCVTEGCVLVNVLYKLITNCNIIFHSHFDQVLGKTTQDPVPQTHVIKIMPKM